MKARKGLQDLLTQSYFKKLIYKRESMLNFLVYIIRILFHPSSLYPFQNTN